MIDQKSDNNVSNKAKLSPEQQLLLFFYQRAESQQLKRDVNNNVYKPVGDGRYQYKCTLQEFMASSVMPREEYPEQYAIYTSNLGIPNQMFGCLRSTTDPRFPYL